MDTNKPLVVYKNNFPLSGILGLIFITLKLTGYIAWSWWCVLAPFWAPLAFAIGLILVALVSVSIVALFAAIFAD